MAGSRTCILCDSMVLTGEPFTAVLAYGPDGNKLVNLPVHFACFSQMITGEVVKGLSDRDYPVFEYEGDLRSGFRDAVMKVISKYLEED